MQRRQPHTLCSPAVADILGVPADVITELMLMHDIPGPLPADLAHDIATGRIAPPGWLLPVYNTNEHTFTVEELPELAQQFVHVGNHVLAGLLQSSIGARSHPDHEPVGAYTIATPAGDGDMLTFTFNATYLTAHEPHECGYTFTIHRPHESSADSAHCTDTFILDTSPLWLAHHIGMTVIIPDALITALTTTPTADGPTGHMYGYITDDTINPDTHRGAPIAALPGAELMDLFLFDADLTPPVNDLDALQFNDAPHLIELDQLQF